MLTKQQMWDIAFKTLGAEYQDYTETKLVIVMEDSGDVEALYEALKEGEGNSVADTEKERLWHEANENSKRLHRESLK